VAGWLWLTLSAFYVLLLGGHIYSPDGTVMYQVTRSWVDEGQLDFPVLLDHEVFGGPVSRTDANGVQRRHSKYGPALSVASLPAYALSRALLPATSDDEQGIFHTPATYEGQLGRYVSTKVRNPDIHSFRRLWYPTSRNHFEEAFGAFLVTWTNAAIVGGTCSLLYLLLRVLGFSAWTSVGWALACGLASPMLHYSGTFWSEPLAALACTGTGWALARHAESGRHRDLVYMGGFFGLLVATKIALGILVFPLLLALWCSRSWVLPQAFRSALWFSIGAAPGILLTGLYNHVRLGAPWNTGYSPQVDAWTSSLWEGLPGLLISPGRGLLWHFPLVVVAVWGIRHCRGSARSLAVFGMAGLAALMVLYCRWWDWGGSWCWGPRFLVPMLPLLFIPIAAGWEASKNQSRRPIKAVLGLSGLVALNGILVNPHDYYQWMKALFRSQQEAFEVMGIHHFFELLYWDWHFAPLVRWWTFPVRETQLLPAVVGAPGIIAVLFSLVLAGLLIGALNLRWALVQGDHSS